MFFGPIYKEYVDGPATGRENALYFFGPKLFVQGRERRRIAYFIYACNIYKY
jgi:hypothetical protein